MSEYNLKTGDLLLFDYKAGGILNYVLNEIISQAA